ncbi:MAG: Fatty acid oxidation complex subunit alpha [Saprospiraceae bacterium]|jgi:3-hydroxybutyryl-CoA dehydrogenase|nr:Fatty acid oxidation complex subunit alpha [Saprospiraceae bacterium]
MMDRERFGIVGAGAMGSGIAQLAAMSGHDVVVVDLSSAALDAAASKIRENLNLLETKGKLTPIEVAATNGRLHFADTMEALPGCQWVIEAVAEKYDVKNELLGKLNHILPADCLVATNTSSLSVNALATSSGRPKQFLGMHFFNPPLRMPLVELIPGLNTDPAVTNRAVQLMELWGKQTVLAQDTPGFIVNRIARPYYTEALRILEEGIADCSTIDAAMTEIHGFKMGPFALMDFIGNDVNYAVTNSVWEGCYCEPRYRPSVTQRNLVMANRLGKKTGIGFYDYSKPMPKQKHSDELLLLKIANRILLMLINEAVDAWYFGIASRSDIDKAMTLGVSYPKGLLEWSLGFGISHCIEGMADLYDFYREERYRTSPGFPKWISENSQ